MVAILGLWIDTGSGPVRNPALSDEEFEAGKLVIKNNNLNTLWQAAHDYETSRISGSITPPLTVHFSVIPSLTKNKAVRAWINTIWDLYYTRKPLVTYEWDPTLYDFSSCGESPYTASELKDEIYRL